MMHKYDTFVNKLSRFHRAFGHPIGKEFFQDDMKLPLALIEEEFKELVEAGAHFLWINKRLKHCTKSAAAFPSMLAVLEGHDIKQTRLI